MKTLSLIVLFFATSIMAQGYRAPKLNVPKDSPRKAVVQKPSIDDQDSFKVSEEFEADRDLASDEELKLKWSESYEKDATKPAKKTESDERIIPWKMLD